jgi:hypothetical protein
MLEAGTVASHLERIARDGFTLIEGAFDPDLAGRLLESATRWGP